ncbi:MAG TPA: hypothetical protein VGR31_13130 [Planctomycetota bacterium]|jgi:hypothetical protein|nr:hypothetical protein [Planctomycetota bacterium]
MSTEPPSPERARESLATRIRESLSSLTTLRAFIILSFFLYEAPFIRRLYTGEPWLPLPLWDISLVDDPRTFVVLEVAYVCASVIACFPRFVIPGCFVAGTASILLVAFDLTYRLQFAFLPGGALIAFALMEIAARRKGPKCRIDLPLVLFLSSIYGFASFHKLLNFQWMKTLLPSAIFNAPGGPAQSFCASPESVFLALIAWTVVPYEALLALLTVTRRWLKLRLACVGLFHWLLVALVPYIWHVALFMLCLHLYLAAMQRPAVRQRMYADRNWLVLIGAEFLFFGLKSWAPSIAGPAGTILGAIAFANFALFPVFFMYWPFWRDEAEHARTGALGLSGISGACVTSFGVLLLTFGFSPFLLEKNYSVLSLGWAMFAGGEYSDGSYYTMKTPATPCFTYPAVYNMVWCEATEKELRYLSFRKSDLERLKKLFERRKCPGPPLKIEAGRF